MTPKQQALDQRKVGKDNPALQERSGAFHETKRGVRQATEVVFKKRGGQPRVALTKEQGIVNLEV